MDPFPYWIGHDGREQDAYDVCMFSAQRKSSIPLYIRGLKHRELRQNGYFWREWRIEGKSGRMIDVTDGRPFSTEFAHSRFLVPALQKYTGWALFTDCDVLWLDDIARLYQEREDKYAVMVVKQVHAPSAGLKMDAQVQQPYPRKNWSSVILFNCGHPANRALTVDHVNKASGADLHGFAWLDDKHIGELSPGWNFLVGYSKSSVKPRLMHYTDGGPWFDHMRDTAFAGWWINEFDHMLKTRGRFL